jgi:transcriptional regulator of acetoin/glycerol metabolism
VDDVASLTIRQQVELSDWIQRQRGTIQVISIALQPIGPLVREGRFLEGLFYRLNTVSISAKGYRS